MSQEVYVKEKLKLIFSCVLILICLPYFVNIAARLESCAAFLPAIVPCLPMETPPNFLNFLS